MQLLISNTAYLTKKKFITYKMCFTLLHSPVQKFSSSYKYLVICTQKPFHILKIKGKDHPKTAHEDPEGE
jgi:hypothetical protein